MKNVLISTIIILSITNISFSENYSLSFDGVDDYVIIPYNSTMNIGSGDFTIEAWINRSVTGVRHNIIERHSGASGYIIALYVGSDNKIHGDTWEANNPTYLTSNSTVATGWKHIAFVRSGTTHYIYIDGSLDKSSSGTVRNFNANAPYNIGRNPDNQFYFKGLIDEVRFWSVARTETEIQQNMYKELSGDESGLVAYYKMSDGSGTTLTDNSTNSNNGTLMNGTIWYIESPSPVQLTSFYASVFSNSVQLSWQTASEVNNYGYDIERLFNTLQNQSVTGWEKIGFVAGHGNSNSSNYYSFIDENPKSGINYYRLKQICLDGKYEYSDIIEVTFDTPTKYALEQNYPNPFNATTTIKYSISNDMVNLSKHDTRVSLKIYDILGREVYTLVNEKQPAGTYEVKFDGSVLSSGIYFYKLQAGNISYAKKLLLMKH